MSESTKEFRPERFTTPLLLALALGIGYWAFTAFPDRPAEVRPNDLTIVIANLDQTRLDPDDGVVVEFTPFDGQGHRFVTVEVDAKATSRPPEATIELSAASAPGGLGPTDLLTSNVDWHAAGQSWQAEHRFPIPEKTELVTNGLVAEGVISAPTVVADDAEQADANAGVSAAFVFPISDPAGFDWSGDHFQGLGDDRVVYTVPIRSTTEDPILSSSRGGEAPTFDVDGTNSSAQRDDNRGLFFAGALVAVAGGALTAAIPEGARLLRRGRPTRPDDAGGKPVD